MRGDESNTTRNESSENVPSQASASHDTMAPSENALPSWLVKMIIKMAADNGMTLQPHQVPAFYEAYNKWEKLPKQNQKQK